MSAVRTKTFASGNSEAVRLPKGVGFGVGVEVTVERKGDAVLLRAASDADLQRRRLEDFITAMASLPAPSAIQDRDLIEAPERPGL